MAGVGDYPAIELFVQRAAAVRPDFELTAEVSSDVAAICMSLDGLPLAIELAAARIDVLSPAQIRERLGNRFDLLVDGGRDTTARQQTLRGAINWSISLLDEEQRTFFARLGVFSGTFDLDAAACIGMASDAQALELVTALVRQSMVSVVGGERYRLLDTLRAYALDMLDGLDADATRDRHAACFIDLAESAEQGIQGPDQVAWLARLRMDVEGVGDELREIGRTTGPCSSGSSARATATARRDSPVRSDGSGPSTACSPTPASSSSGCSSSPISPIDVGPRFSGRWR